MAEIDVQPLIQERAYQLWQARGCPSGCDLELWLEAEAVVGEELRAAPATKPRAARKKPVLVALPVAEPEPEVKIRKPRAAKA